MGSKTTFAGKTFSGSCKGLPRPPDNLWICHKLHNLVKYSLSPSWISYLRTTAEISKRSLSEWTSRLLQSLRADSSQRTFLLLVFLFVLFCLILFCFFFYSSSHFFILIWKHTRSVSVSSLCIFMGKNTQRKQMETCHKSLGLHWLNLLRNDNLKERTGPYLRKNCHHMNPMGPPETSSQPSKGPEQWATA